MRSRAARRLRRRSSTSAGAVLVLAIMLLALCAPWVAPHDPEQMDMERRLASPTSEHWLGTDNFGRDLFSRAVFWTESARLVRAISSSEKSRDYVLAARALGASHSRILFREILPRVAGPLLVVITLAIGTAIVAESGLSFLGFGVQPPTPTWGWTLAYGMRYLRESVWQGGDHVPGYVHRSHRGARCLLGHRRAGRQPGGSDRVRRTRREGHHQRPRHSGYAGRTANASSRADHRRYHRDDSPSDGRLHRDGGAAARETIDGGKVLGRIVSPYTFEELEVIENTVPNGVMILAHLTRNVVQPGDYLYMVGGVAQ